MHYINNDKLTFEDFKKIEYVSYLFSNKDIDEALGLKAYFSDIYFGMNFNEFRNHLETGNHDNIYFVSIINSPADFSASGLIIPTDISKDFVFVGNVTNKGTIKSFIIDLTESRLPRMVKRPESIISIATLKKDSIETATNNQYLELTKTVLNNILSQKGVNK